MKNIFTFAVVLFIAACSSGPSSKSLEVENQTLRCWSDGWSQQKGFNISEGFDSLDAYLLETGHLGVGEVPDYEKFAKDTGTIEIPAATKGFLKMKTSLGGEFAGAPDVGTMGKCWEENWFNKIKELDSTDVIARLGKEMKALADAGAPDVDALRIGFFKDLTKEELNRPLVKAIFYLMFSSRKLRFSGSKE